MIEKKEILLSYKDSNRWEIRKEIIVNLITDGSRYVVIKGFITDLASIPRIFWAILPPFGKYILAAIIHDYMYKSKQVSRKFADKEFLLRMKEDGVPFLTRNIMYHTVRAFGWLYWK